MANTLPSPPQSRSPSPTPSHDKANHDLTRNLDELLEQYLHLLDHYTTLREELSKTFSAGFFSLAQAQRTSTLGAGRRYGEECYDERMKAQRRVDVSEDEDEDGAEGCYTFQIAKIPKKTDVEENETREEENSNTGAREGEEQAELKPAESDKDMKEKQQKKTTPKQDPARRDPVTWFGILVPPALRQTQTHFTKATEKTIPALLSVESRMKSVEANIWAVRKDLGILADYEEEVGQSEEAAENVPEQMVHDKSPPKEQGQSQSVSRRKLASRPAHSRSPLLQLGE